MARSTHTTHFGANTKDFEQGMIRARNSANQAFKSISQSAQSASFSFGAAAAGGAAISSKFIEAAATMQDLQGSMLAVAHSTEEANKQLQFIVDFTKTTKFDLKGTSEAGLKLQGLGFTASETLPTIAKLAAGMNKDLPDAAAIVGKAMLGSRRSITQLRDSYGVTTSQLQLFGAEVDKNGLVLVKGQKNIEKLQNAIKGLVEARYGKIFEVQANNLSVVLSNLGDETFQALAGLGKAVAPEIIYFARVLTDLINRFNSLDDSTKGTIGRTALIGTALAGAASAAAGLIAVVAAVASQFSRLATFLKTSETFGVLFKELGSSAAVATGEVTEVAGSLGAVETAAAGAAETLVEYGAAGEAITDVAYLLAAGASVAAAGWVVLGAVVVAVANKFKQAAERIDKDLGYGIIDKAGTINRTLSEGIIPGLWRLGRAWSSAEDEAGKSLDTQLKIIANYSRSKELIHLSAEEAKKAGYTELDAANVALGLSKRKQQAEKDNRKELAETYGLQLAYVQNLIPLLVGAEKTKLDANRDTLQKSKELFTEAQSLDEEYTKNRKNHIYENSREELAALDAGIAATKAALEFKNSLSKEKYQELANLLERQTEERVSLDRKAYKEQAQEESKHISRQLQANEITKTQAAKLYAELAEKYKDSKELEEKFHTDSEQNKREAIKETLQATIEAADVEASLFEQRRLANERAIKKGKEVSQNSAQAVENSKKQLEYELKKIEAEKNKEVNDTADPLVKETAARKAILDATKAQEAHEERIKNIKQLGLDNTRKQIELTTELLKAKEALKNAELDDLNSQLDKGKNVGNLLLKATKDRQKLSEQALESEKKQRLVGVTDEKERAKLIAEYDTKAKINKTNNQKEVEAVDKQISQAQEQRREQLIQIAEREAKLKKLSIGEQKKEGKDVKVQEIKLAEDLAQIEISKIQSKLESDKLGKDATAQALLQREAELEISAIKKSLKKDIDDINDSYKKGNDELQKQKDSLKEINDELAKLKGEQQDRVNRQGALIGGVEDLVKENERESKIFELEAKKRRTESSIKDREASDKAIESNRREGDRFGITRGGKNAAEQARDAEIQAIEEERRQKKEQEAADRRAQGRAQAEEVLRRKGTSEEDIKRILGTNFDAKNTFTPLDQKKTQDFAGAGAKDPAVDILSAIYNLIAKSLGKPVNAQGPSGTKPNNQLNQKGKNDLSSNNPYTGSSDGPYPT